VKPRLESQKKKLTNTKCKDPKLAVTLSLAPQKFAQLLCPYY